MRGFYFKGCRLWERGEEWHSVPSRSDGSGALGARRKYATKSGHAPNWQREVVVTTIVEEVTAQADLDQHDTLDVIARRIEERLIALSQTPGDLARVADVSQRANVTGGPYSAGSGVVVSHDTPAGSWTPTAGRLVLFRNPSTRAGFVATISSTGSGTITCDLDEDVSTAWDVLPVVAVYPDVHFENVDPGRAELDRATDRWRPGLEFTFSSRSDSENATAHDVAMDDT